MLFDVNLARVVVREPAVSCSTLSQTCCSCPSRERTHMAKRKKGRVMTSSSTAPAPRLEDGGATGAGGEELSVECIL